MAEVAAFESCMLTMLTEVVWVCAHLRKARASAVDVDPSRWRRWPAMRFHFLLGAARRDRPNQTSLLCIESAGLNLGLEMEGRLKSQEG